VTPTMSRLALAIYGGISVLLVAVFLLLTLLSGKDYTPASRYGGAVWVFILGLIITMPLVIPAVRRRAGGGG